MMIEKPPNEVLDQPRQPWRWWVSGLGIVVGTIAIGAWVVTIPSFPLWTQFEEKGLWDLFELIAALGIPIVLAIFGYWFTRTENERQHAIAAESRAQERKLSEEARTAEQILAEKARGEERKIAKEAREEERRLALDNQQERALQEYMDRMTELILKEGLQKSKENDEVRAVAHSRTHAVLRRLDPQRRSSVIQFLLDAKLIGREMPIIGLRKADLTGVHLRNVGLRGINMANTQLMKADLREADLAGAYFREADLTEANLSGASLQKADLTEADLTEADLSGADLRGANLTGTDLTGANLSGTDLLGTKFDGATLTDAVLPPDFRILQAHLPKLSQDKGLHN
jgi:uncharacterized protein YjbI with pentapeptide repeats